MTSNPFRFTFPKESSIVINTYPNYKQASVLIRFGLNSSFVRTMQIIECICSVASTFSQPYQFYWKHENKS